jgi:hypothetical protein
MARNPSKTSAARDWPPCPFPAKTLGIRSNHSIKSLIVRMRDRQSQTKEAVSRSAALAIVVTFFEELTVCS